MKDQFVEWFKKTFGRTPNSHNETDSKLRAAWNNGYNQAMKEAAEYAQAAKAGFIGNYHS